MPGRGRVLALALAAIVSASCRHSGVESSDLDGRIASARQVQLQQGPRAALPLYESILASARAAQDRKHEGLTLGHMGTAFKNLGDLRRAMDLHQQALVIKRAVGDEIEIGKTLSNMGLVEEAEGHCDKALAVYGQSLEIFTRLDKPQFAASVLNNEGLCYDALGDFQQSRSVYERALTIHREQENEIGESETLGNLGGIDLLFGRYAEGAGRYEQSLAISTRLGLKQSMALDLINLGLARLGAGQLREASEHLQHARTLAHEAGLLREEADAERGLSQWLERTGRYDDARRALADASSLYARKGLARESVDARVALGGLDLGTGDVVAAAVEFERASNDAQTLRYHNGQLAAELALAELELRRHNSRAAARHVDSAQRTAATVKDSANAAASLMLLSRIKATEKDFAAALQAADNALKVSQETKGPLLVSEALITLGDALMGVRRAQDAYAKYDEALRSEATNAVPDLQWHASFGRGRALEGLGRPDAALADYLRAVGLIEQVRGELAGDRSRSGFLDDKRDVYAALVRLLLRLGRPNEAFQVAERLRAQGYRELIGRSLTLGAPGNSVPATLLARIRQLQSSMDTELRRPAPEQRGQAVALYRLELHEAEEAWTTAVDSLVPKTRWARELNLDAQPSAARVQQQLSGKSALLEYLVDRDETVAFVVTRRAVRAQVLPVGAEALRTRIELLRGLLTRKESDGWQQVAQQLDADLVDPLRRLHWLDAVSRLYIVPHAELNYLPFSVLRHHAGTGDRFLVDDVAPVTLPSAEALTEPGTRRAVPLGLLALAPARARLPFAQQEVASLAALFPASHEVLSGRDATEVRFKADAGRYRVLHLATHGFFNRVDPLFSGVELEPGGEDDGRLQVFEILGLPLGSDLVTLSACDTALGAGELSDLPAGEELVGLTRAFLSAGSRNVVASLWDVSDRATSPLMTAFYRAAQNRAFPEALASVQRQRAHAQGPEAHPWYWAAFVIAEGREGRADKARTGP
jgi:CHAT domain-containing protein